MTRETASTPRVLDTYGLTYAFTALLLVPGLFIIDRLSIVMYSPAYLALMAVPFVLGPALVFALDSDDGPRTLAIRSAVLAPLTALTGVTFVFLAMIVIVLPLSFWIMPVFSDYLSTFFAFMLVVVSVPLVVSLLSRLREGLSPAGVLKTVALALVVAVVAWIVAMTLGTSDTLDTFLRKDLVKQFAAAFAWYLPALALAAGLWRRAGVV